MRFIKKNILVFALHYWVVGVQLVSGIFLAMHYISNVFFNIFIKIYLINKISDGKKKNEL